MILPCFYSFQIKSELSVEEISNKLAAKTLIGPAWGERTTWHSPSFFFRGSLSDKGFEIRRSLSYYSSFEPYISGRYREAQKGVEIDIRMTMHPIALGLVIFYFFFVIFIFFPGVVKIYEKLGRFEFGLLIPVVMLFGGVAITQGTFWTEALKSREFLLQILEGKVVRPRE